MNEEWQKAFGQMTYGIYVLTARLDDTINGMIASWVTQVSYSPPLIMVAIHPNRYSHALIDKSKVFALHIIDRSQKDLLARFKGPDPLKKFAGIPWQTGKTGVPILKDCSAWFELEVKERHCPGNHTLFVGEVVNCDFQTAGTPFSTMDYEGMYVGKD
jgi:flavin reductase (DIM6/NTAB) family NADH-FMN oxidoreductase RutF